MAAAVVVPILTALLPEIPAIEQAIASLFHKGVAAVDVAAQLQISYNAVKALDTDAMATLAQIPTLPPVVKTP
jgi:DNA-binding NarL/FixJ family response regulator